MIDVPLDPEEFFVDYLPKRFAEEAAELALPDSVGSAVFHIESGGTWACRLVEGKVEVEKAMADDAIVQITVAASDFEDLVADVAHFQEQENVPADQLLALKALTLDDAAAKLVRAVTGSISFEITDARNVRRVVLTPGSGKVDFDTPQCSLHCQMHDLDHARSLAREEALATPGVARVLMPADMEPAPAEGDDAILLRARRSFVPDRVGDLLLVLDPHCLPSDAVDVTTHISPHPYDAHVPLILFGPGIEPAREDRRVSSVDVAPTVGAILGLTPAEPPDGEVLPGFRADRLPAG